jgi:carbon-monoxide dehydrogenase medium subunit
MYPGPFRYHRPGSLAQAVAQLAALDGEARVLAGGQSLIAAMKTRLAAPADLVDIGFIPGLAYLRQDHKFLRVGALTRHRDVEMSKLPVGLELLHDAASVIADVQVRNRGTVLGSLAQADPGGDWAPVMLALAAELDAIGPVGSRIVPVRGFFRDLYTTDLAPYEVLSELRIAVPVAGQGGAYLALKRRAGDFAIAAAAVVLTIDARGLCRRAGIGLGNVGAKPLIAETAERLLLGQPPDDPQIVAAVAESAMAAADPGADNNGSAEYKREVLGVLVRRALAIALRRCRGETVRASDHV